MADTEHTPVLGGTAPRTAKRTAQKLAGFAIKHIQSISDSSKPRQYLDIGCGNGFITEQVGAYFDQITGIDVETIRLEEFRASVSQDQRYSVVESSADNTKLPDNCFSMITSFEVLEHVPNLIATVNEIVRVCKTGGVIIISVPQRWFPFENHGMHIGNRIIERKIPLLPYIPALHRKYALARVFTSKEMDSLFVNKGLQCLETTYASPQFERAAASPSTWESRIKFVAPLLEKFEKIPGLKQLTGVSMLKAYKKS